MANSTYLPWKIFGRRVQPFATGITLSTMIIAIVGTVDSNNFFYAGGSLAGLVVTLSAYLASALMLIGWWAQRHTLLLHGLLFACWVWSAKSVGTLMTSGSLVNEFGVLSFAWAMAAAGAYLLEMAPESHKYEGVL